MALGPLKGCEASDTEMLDDRVQSMSMSGETGELKPLLSRVLEE